MKKLEVILNTLCLVTFGFVLEGSAKEVFLLLMTLLSFLYLIFGFVFLNGIRLRKLFKKESYIGVSTLRIIGSALAGFSFSSAVLGVLFWVMDYTGTSEMLTIGLVGLVPVLAIAIFKYYQQTSSFYRDIIVRTVIWGGITAVLFLS